VFQIERKSPPLSSKWENSFPSCSGYRGQLWLVINFTHTLKWSAGAGRETLHLLHASSSQPLPPSLSSYVSPPPGCLSNRLLDICKYEEEWRWDLKCVTFNWIFIYFLSHLLFLPLIFHSRYFPPCWLNYSWLIHLKDVFIDILELVSERNKTNPLAHCRCQKNNIHVVRFYAVNHVMRRMWTLHFISWWHHFDSKSKIKRNKLNMSTFKVKSRMGDSPHFDVFPPPPCWVHPKEDADAGYRQPAATLWDTVWPLPEAAEEQQAWRFLLLPFKLHKQQILHDRKTIVCWLQKWLCAVGTNRGFMVHSGTVRGKWTCTCLALS